MRETHAEIGTRLGRPLARATQVHGNNVIIAAASGSEPPEADALVAATSDVGAMVITADCLPVVVAAPGAVAAIHAGWRGLEAGVIASAVALLRTRGHGVLTAAIGPGAGVCCYEVSDELHRRFKAHSQDFHRGRNLDLKAIARTQLMEAGVARIHDCGICTICSDPELLFSHRRDGAQTGRQAAIAWLS